MNRTTVILLMGFFSFLFGSSKAQSPEAPKKNADDAGRDLRNMVLAMPPEKMGGKATKEFPRVYGILMDWPIGDVTATILSTSTGAASLYTTSTFGIVGGEGHESVRAAAIKFVRAADRLFDTAKPTTVFPYPAANHVHFYLLTFDGVRVVDAELAAIESGTSKYAEFFGLGQDVLTELRIVTEKR
jgi:hypothetical protein